MHLNRSTIAIWAIALLAAGFASNLLLTCGSNLVAFALVAVLTLGLCRGSLHIQLENRWQSADRRF
jgi:hypothetical protein